MFKGNGRTALLAGIANLTARYLLEEDYNVILCTHSQEQAEAMRSGIPEELHSRLMIRFCRIEDPKELEDCLAAGLERFGSIDVLVNGIGMLENSDFEKTDPEQFRKIVSSHLFGIYSCMKQTIPVLLRGRSPRIVNITCVDGRSGHFDFGVGSAAGKEAVAALTRTVALEYADRGLRANCIAVGALHTLRKRSREECEELEKQIPVGRIATAADIAPAVLFLCAEETDYLTGTVVNASGGVFLD